MKFQTFFKGGESVDPMQIMLMTQLLKDTEETAEGEPEEGLLTLSLHLFQMIKTFSENLMFPCNSLLQEKS